MEEVHTKERAEQDLVWGAITEKCWLNKIWDIHREDEVVRIYIYEKGSTKSQLNKLEKLRKQE